ncbi:hypothetical protein SAMN04487911_12833 [Arenibacter nanhaiticus]|uniref:Uncharacterized protein n=1 Tax=Arenibacter nanhaiticus TaxID=558155 RepID=A0A1M6KXE2_9FLAO|nr:hypothetical protein [Arenibacter nanhaiticus]SHJ63579.1 hypothetical protein SAMN04487911_12833 [Arenibacter nanhaiticus]
MEKLELHYYLSDKSHSMDAFVKNKAEAELLKVFKEISDILELDLSFEIEALKEGGIKEFIKFLKKKKNRKQIVKILAFIGVIFSGVLTNKISDNFNKNSELEKSQLEESQLNIKKLKRDLEKEDISEKESTFIIENLTMIISNTDKIKFHRSNFYSHLLKENKIEQISTTELDENNKPISKEKKVLREDFNKFIVHKIKIDSEFIEDANIEIISPVLRSGKMKWRGYYDSKPISFNLLDLGFKNSVLNREVSFQNGTSIKCLLEFEKEMDDEGNIKTTEINVFDVTNIFEGETTILTKRGKEIKAEKKQIKLDFGTNEE